VERRVVLSITFALSGCVPASAPNGAPPPRPAPATFELDRAGQARQALNRLTFGPRPGDIEAVEKMGVERWLDSQLQPDQVPDAATERVLGELETQHKQPFELIADHPLPQELVSRIRPRMLPDGTESKPSARDSQEYRQAAQAANALSGQVTAARVLRAVQSERQLLEVMVDFWENHFSVSINKSPNRYSMLAYDRDVIRAHALGKFRDLLGAVAKSPQMLFYLDQAQSGVDSMHPTIPEARIQARRAATEHVSMDDPSLMGVVSRRRSGLNENYARELMELHTLGVNGGYTQQDVIEVARALTGWSVDRADLGGTFVFRPDNHDAGEKNVLGTKIPAGRGIEDGEAVLDIIAKHPSTAHFIARKLVVRFVSDTPADALVERAAQTFLRTDGDIREVMRTIVMSPEFFSERAFRAKVKTPFELVVSTLRAFDAPPDTTQRTARLIAGLGQPLWGHLTPEGWPDQGEAWMNSGALLSRMNFSAQVADGKVPVAPMVNWRLRQGLLNLAARDQVQGVIDALLEGRASAPTRAAMNSVIESAANERLQPTARLSQIVGVALGSPEFQRR
jgi:uncharacterized protein (DUF1800 family)